MATNNTKATDWTVAEVLQYGVVLTDAGLALARGTGATIYKLKERAGYVSDEPQTLVIAAAECSKRDDNGVAICDSWHLDGHYAVGMVVAERPQASWGGRWRMAKPSGLSRYTRLFTLAPDGLLIELERPQRGDNQSTSYVTRKLRTD